MAWRRPGDKPLSEPMMVSSPTHICVSRPQWVKADGRPTASGSDVTSMFQNSFDEILEKCSTLRLPVRKDPRKHYELRVDVPPMPDVPTLMAWTLNVTVVTSIHGQDKCVTPERLCFCTEWRNTCEILYGCPVVAWRIKFSTFLYFCISR